MKYNNIEFTKEDGIGILKINRPKALNALNTETVTELNQCVGEIENDAEVKVLIITGGGEKSFVAGADIVEMSTKNAVEGRFFGKIAQDAFTCIENLPQPVIAAVNGSDRLKSVSVLPRVSAVHSVCLALLAAVTGRNSFLRLI